MFRKRMPQGSPLSCHNGIQYMQNSFTLYSLSLSFVYKDTKAQLCYMGLTLQAEKLASKDLIYVKVPTLNICQTILLVSQKLVASVVNLNCIMISHNITRKSLLGVPSFFHQRIPLDFLQGDKFRESADNYIRPLLTKVCIWYFSYSSYSAYLLELSILTMLFDVSREFLHYSLIFLLYMITLERLFLHPY